MMLKPILVAAGATSILAQSSSSHSGSDSRSGMKIAPKYYVCNELTGFCEMEPLTSPGSPHAGTSQQKCLLTCKGTVWPAPSEIQQMVTGSTSDFCNILFSKEAMYGSEPFESIAIENFVESLSLIKQSDGCEGVLTIVMNKTDSHASSSDPLTLQTDESYSLEIITNAKGNPVATISSATFYGGRHGLETLSQLITTDTDPLSRTYGMNTVADTVTIHDTPAFPYRGIMLDTSRHYLSVPTIKSVIRGMGYNKLNRLHLHFTDTASFPLHIPTEPNLFMYGGYTTEMYYDEDRIKELMEFAHGYGVSIIPEVDVPSHVNMGWNWGQLEDIGDLAICTNDDWTTSSLEPPGGHLNIANPAVYPLLHNIYSFLGEQFEYPDIFHIGGDEVVVGSDETSAACWNSTEYGGDILNLLTTLGLSRDDQDSFYALWHGFTHRIVDMISDVYTTSPPSPPSLNKETPRPSPKNIIWGGNVEPIVGPSPVTYNMVARPDVVQELPPSDYIMEIWDDSADSIAPSLLQQGYDVIAVNFDYVYLDCGQPGFTNPGGYWCGPYHEWSHIYEYMHDLQTKWNLTPDGYAKDSTDTDTDTGVGRIIGSEVLLWGEENGDSSVMTKLFPRAAALAEGLWSNPQPGAGVKGKDSGDRDSGMRSKSSGSSSSSNSMTKNNRTKTKSDNDGDSDGDGDSDHHLWYLADPRMQLWRNKLAARGVGAAAMQPLWCTQRGPYACTIDEGEPQ